MLAGVAEPLVLIELSSLLLQPMPVTPNTSVVSDAINIVFQFHVLGYAAFTSADRGPAGNEVRGCRSEPVARRADHFELSLEPLADPDVVLRRR